MLSRVLATARLVTGVAALVIGLDGVNLFLAAPLVAATIVLDGAAQWIGGGNRGSGSAPARLDDLTDYLTIVVVPWFLTQSMLVGSRSLIQEVLLDLPLVAGAVRCAGGFAGPGGAGTGGARRGLSPALFALVVIAAVFLHLPAVTAPARLTMMLAVSGGVISALMLAPVRYGPLPRPLAAASLVYLAIMPFVLSEVMAGAAVLGALAYLVVGPLIRGTAPATTDRGAKTP
jgi:phosphatidylserine synthase